MTRSEPVLEAADDDLEQDEDGRDGPILLLGLREGAHVSYAVRPDALTPRQWGRALAGAARMVAYALAADGGNPSARRQAEILVAVTKEMRASLDRPGSDLTVWKGDE